MHQRKHKRDVLPMTTRQGIVMLFLLASFLVLLLIIMIHWQ